MLKKIAIIADTIDDQWAGIYTVSKELITALEEHSQDEFEFTYIHHRENAFFADKKELIIPIKKYFPGARSLHKFFTVPGILKKHNFDLVHDLYHIAPFPFKKTLYKKVVTIHDLTPILFPKWHVPKGNLVQRFLLPRLFKTVDGIIAVSESTKNDILKLYHPKVPIWVTHLAGKKFIVRHPGTCLPVGKESQDLSNNSTDIHEIPEQVPDKITHKPYILFVSTIEPRKGLDTLIHAFENLKAFGLPHELVVVGKEGWKCEEILARILNSPMAKDIIWKKYVSDEELGTLYGNASLFVYPSRYEGFGLPILEAMNTGIPVVASNNSSIPEVIGNGGVLFETDNAEDLLEKMLAVLLDKKYRELLLAEGAKQAKNFSWKKTAEETLNIYRSLLRKTETLS